MSFILWLIIGGLLGWVASMIMGTNDQQGKLLNIVVGIVGAFLGGLLAGLHAGLDLESAVDRLPPGARSVFVLHDVEGYKHEEIGTLLGVSVGTSKSQLHRARMTLRGHLTQAVPAHD